MDRTLNLRTLLALYRMPGMGPIKLGRWIKRYDLTKLFKQPRAVLSPKDQNDRTLAYLRRPDWQGVDADLAWAAQLNCHILTTADPHYPKAFREIYGAPPLLFVKGRSKILNKPQLAIVGTRHPSRIAKVHAYEFAEALSKQQWSITSGLALGIDKQAHCGALAGTGGTVAVLANGLDAVYPRSHQRLADQIVEAGALISEFPTGIEPKANHFPRRNRLISGLSRGVLVVEAAVKSGSLITARFALEQNKEVFAIPGCIQNPLAKGTHQLIREGAKLVDCLEDILEELQAQMPAKPHKVEQLSLFKQPDWGGELDATVQKVLSILEYEKMVVDDIIAQTGLCPSEVAVALSQLELLGLIDSVPGGYAKKLLPVNTL